MMEIYKKFEFEAARHLPNLSPEHPCAGMHGHSFKVTMHLSGALHPTHGWVVDFKDIVDAFDPLWRQLDHRVLNDIPGLENPTSENLARWIWDRLKPQLPQLSMVHVQETASSGCLYRGE